VWYSEVARSLVADTGVPDPVAAIRSLAQKLVEQAEVSEPPVDLQLVGSLQGVVVVKYKRIPAWGELWTLPSGEFQIVLSDQQGRGRARFSHAHEIAHTLIPSYRRRPQARRDSQTGMYGRDAEEEFLCDAGASEILMPTSLFLRFASDRPAALATVVQAAATFDVSLEAAGIRLVECALSPCAIIFWEEKLKPSQAVGMESQTRLPGFDGLDPKPKLRVRFGLCSAPMEQHFFPPSKSVDDDSPLSDCLNSDRVVAGLCSLPTGRGPVLFQTESVSAPYRAGTTLHKRVITLARAPA
jgi:Zn-dependent peptidase ImmA (M78 family)